jgi:N-acetylneuraminic acid mutarotase
MTLLLILTFALLHGGAGRHPHRAIRHSAVRGGQQARVLRVYGRPTGRLPAPIQDAAAAPVAPLGFLLLGGLDQAEGSTSDILSVTAAGAHRISTLPHALHDASASFLDGAIYLFGGGVIESFSQITRIGTSGSARPAGSLPTPASDIATATIGGTVYIVGGYTGQTPLRTILAWRPGGQARVVGTLPKPLRYAAVASAGGKLVIAGGTSGETASRDVYRFDPRTGTLSTVGLLPNPLTHAAASSFAATVLLFGGREASATSQTRQVLAIEPDGRIRRVGELPLALSDMAAAKLGERVVLAGGRDAAGHVQDTILTMTPQYR